MESEYTEGTANEEKKSIFLPPNCKAYEPQKKTG